MFNTAWKTLSVTQLSGLLIILIVCLTHPVSTLADTSSPLSHRGFSSSLLLKETEKYSVYIARRGLTGQSKIVFEHDVSDTDKLIPDDLLEEQLKEIIKIINTNAVSAIPIFNGVDFHKSTHYAKGYYHPVDTDDEINIFNHQETPLQQLELNVTKKRARAVGNGRRYGTYVGTLNGISKLATTRAWNDKPYQTVNSISEAIKVYGESRRPRNRGGVKENKKNTKPVAQSAEVNQRSRAVSSGYVFKNLSFWSEFKDESLQKIFNGNHQLLNIDSPLLVAHIQFYLRYKSARCSGTIGSDHAVFTIKEITTTTDGFGHKTSRVTDSETIKVDKRFAPIFARYNGEKPINMSKKEILSSGISLATNTGPTGLLSDLKFKSELARTTKNDVEILYQKVSCGSPVLTQYEENLYRLATGQPSVQAAGFAIPGAKTASDNITSDEERTITQSCIELDKSIYRDLRRDYCKCVEKTVKQLSSKERVREIAANFRAFEDDMAEVGKLINYGKRPSETTLYYETGQCKQ
ncbi:MAG: hypothetical protein JAY72_20440 [Candidatus Thiodiazotropha endolucinida]|nr:hypothetical protein [Candidatus Thiodiazotropha taylori]MCW4324053.1 hypothetical protein [Candidatus Thiodiazotropha taylori]